MGYYDSILSGDVFKLHKPYTHNHNSRKFHFQTQNFCIKTVCFFFTEKHIFRSISDLFRFKWAKFSFGFGYRLHKIDWRFSCRTGTLSFAWLLTLHLAKKRTRKGKEAADRRRESFAVMFLESATNANSNSNNLPYFMPHENKSYIYYFDR